MLSLLISASLAATIQDLACEVQPTNALRIDCSVQTDVPTKAFLDLNQSGTRQQTVKSDTLGTHHEFTLVGLRAETSYKVRVTAKELAGSGSDVQSSWVRTDPLPPEVDIDVMVTASSLPSMEHFIVQTGCGGAQLIIFDRRGRVLWYEDFAGIGLEDSHLEGFDWTEEGTFLALLDRNRIVEMNQAGEVIFNLSQEDRDFTPFVHHDIVRANGRTYVLTAEEKRVGKDLLAVDGVMVLGPTGEVLDRWEVTEAFDPSVVTSRGTDYWDGYMNPKAEDYTHANSLFLDANGDWVISLLLLDSVIKVVGDFSAPDYGELAWELNGSGERGDFLLSSESGATDTIDFNSQHDAWFTSNGLLSIYDNRSDSSEASRVIEIDLDAEAGIADIQNSWSLGIHNSVRGSSTRTDSGRLLVSNSSNTIRELAQDGSETWTATLTCNDGSKLSTTSGAEQVDVSF